MKIRNGFVSNSSSSSFVLPINKNTDDKISIKISIDDFTKVINSDEDSEIYAIVEDEIQLQKFFIDQYGYREKSWEEFLKNEDNDYLLDSYNKKKEVLGSGKILIFGSVGYHEYLATKIIETMGGEIED